MLSEHSRFPRSIVLLLNLSTFTNSALNDPHKRHIWIISRLGSMCLHDLSGFNGLHALLEISLPRISVSACPGWDQCVCKPCLGSVFVHAPPGISVSACPTLDQCVCMPCLWSVLVHTLLRISACAYPTWDQCVCMLRLGLVRMPCMGSMCLPALPGIGVSVISVWDGTKSCSQTLRIEKQIGKILFQAIWVTFKTKTGKIEWVSLECRY